jgi:ABC-type glycerol-3-phosphate transport system substrate-binding protein
MSAGYFNSNAPSIVWTDALAMLQQGKAGFLLMGGFAISNIVEPGGLTFSLMKEKSRKDGPRAVLGSKTGFVFPAGGGNLESALALADRWISGGAAGLTADEFRVSAIARGGAAPPESESFVQAETVAALEAGTRLVPLLDAELATQAAYALREAFMSWPMTGFGSEKAIRDFADRLARIVEESLPPR